MAKNAKSAPAPKEKNPNKGFVHAVKEFCRKFIVSLKRRPQIIPLVAYIVTFLVYSLNLSDVSDTTAKLNINGMGLAGFATMLLGILIIVTCMNSFPYRKKPVLPMVILTFVLAAIVIFADIYYRNIIFNWMYVDGVKVNVINKDNLYIAKAYNMLMTHVILMGVSVALTALLPVYSKLIRKIKTSIEVEGNENMRAIDLSND